MASERVAALAGYLAGNASPFIAEAVGNFHLYHGTDLYSRADHLLKASRDNIDFRIVEKILGRDDDWAQEAEVAANALLQQAVSHALQDRSVWDRRRSTWTRHRLIFSHMRDHIRRWAIERGMDVDEVARRLWEGGGS
jgi:hypothetical protein